MLLIDDRVGSKHYARYFADQAVVARLESGDVAFEGVSGVTVGVEIKKVADAVSCLFTGRLADHQIPLLRQQYDVCYLIVEGLFRPCPASGVLQVGKGTLEGPSFGGRWIDATHGKQRLMHDSFVRWLTTLELTGGVRLRCTSSEPSTAATIQSLYTWFQRDHHKSFDVMQEPIGNTAELSRPSMMRRILALLPHVGWMRSAVLAKRFLTVRHMVNASLNDWYIEGEIAEKSAIDIVRALNGEEKGN